MLIYPSEKTDGLESAIKNNKIALASIARPSKPHDNFSLANASADLIGANPNQIDLYYLETLLVSCGWNENDDVFDPFEIFMARKTPIDKKFNYNHDETDIIGHLTSSFITVSDKAIDENTPFSEIGGDFDITVGAVLYKLWRDEFLQKRMNEIIGEIAEGKWFVSMEALFPTFDYAAINDNGDQFIIPRNETSAHLTKHLRCYGGTGVYDNYRIGRLLRNIIFCGKGLVREPGNVKSLIKSCSFNTQAKLTISNKGKSMSDVDKVKELQNRLEKAEAKNQEMLDQAIAKEQKAYEVQITSLKDELAELAKAKQKLVQDNEVAKATITASNEQIEQLKKELAESKAELEKIQDEFEKIRLEEIKAKRLSMFDNVEIDTEKAKSLVNQFASASDEDFAGLVSAFPVKQGKKSESVKLDLSAAKKDASVTLNTQTPDETQDTRKSMLTNWVKANLNRESK